MGGVARVVIRSLPYLFREVNYSKSMLIDSVLRHVGVYSVKKVQIGCILWNMFVCFLC